MFLSFERSNARKISLEGGGIKILGTQGWGKLGGGKGFFSFKQGGGLTLDDTMIKWRLYDIGLRLEANSFSVSCDFERHETWK